MLPRGMVTVRMSHGAVLELHMPPVIKTENGIAHIALLYRHIPPNRIGKIGAQQLAIAEGHTVKRPLLKVRIG
ncbi:hypothetical protein D3C81_1801300 [compost metagenome]